MQEAAEIGNHWWRRSAPSGDNGVTDPTKALVEASCLCSCIRTRLLNFGRLGDQSRETRPRLPGRSTEVVEVVALEQVVHGPGVVLVDDPVGDELPEQIPGPPSGSTGQRIPEGECVFVIAGEIATDCNICGWYFRAGWKCSRLATRFVGGS